jgi:alpha-N-arabinofuranosidase
MTRTRVFEAFVLFIAFSMVFVVPAAAQTNTATVTVDSTNKIRTVDPRIAGLNTAVWDTFLNNATTRTLLQAAKIGVFRFPGGSLSDTYHWETSTSDPNTTWSTTFDDLAATAIPVGAQAFITVNYGSGTAQEAAGWVQYSNVTKGYGFKYWEIGNECYGSWENDTHSIKQDPYTYAMSVASYMAAMKAMDPTIKIGMVLINGEDSYANNQNHPATNPVTGVVHNGWTPVLLTTLKSLGVTPDFAIYHRYEQAPGQESDAGLLQAAATWKDDAANLRQMLNDYLGQATAAGVEIVCTENNSVYSNPGKQTTSLVNGLYMADSTGELLQTEINSLVWWDLRNGPDPNENNSSSLYGWRKYGDYGIMDGTKTLYPTYYVDKLLSNFARGGEQVLSASSNNQLLAAYATLRPDGGLNVLFINKDPANSIVTQVNLNGYNPASEATVYSYGEPQDKAAKKGVGSPDVQQSTFTSASSSFSITLPSYSATVLALVPPGAVAAPVITSAQFSAPKTLTVTGSGFGATPKVLVNNNDVSSFIKKESDGSITLKGKTKVLGLVSGSNSIQVVGPGGNSNVYTLTM